MIGTTFFGLYWYFWVIGIGIILSFIVASIFIIVKVFKIKDIQIGSGELKIDDRESNFNTRNEYFSFLMSIQALSITIKNIYRASCLNNGFEKMSDNAFDVYTDKKVEQIKERAEQFFTSNWSNTKSNSFITVDDLKTSPILFEIRKVLKTAFIDIRNLSIVEHKEIEKMFEDREKYIEEEIKAIRFSCQGPAVCDIVRWRNLLVYSSSKYADIMFYQNREIIAKQMDKVDEHLIYLQDKIMVTFQSMLDEKVKSRS